MIKSISYWSMPGGLSGECPVDDALQMAKSAGFDGIELCVGLEGCLTPQSNSTVCDRIRAEIEASGLVVETLASGISWAHNPVSNDAADREIAIATHEAALKIAAKLGMDALLFVPGVVNSPIAPNQHVPYGVAINRATEAIRRLLDTAEHVGVDLCIENVWNGFLLSPVELAQFVDGFESQRLGVYFDAGNVMRYHQHPADWIRTLGSRLRRLHVKGFRESFGWGGSYEFCEIGDGDVPWPEVMHALAEIGYDGTIVAEMLPYSEGLLERTSRQLGQLIDQIPAKESPVA